jgi:hypothetical protein
MIIVPQTPITESSFDKWKCHRIDVDEEDDKYHYYVIPLVDIDENELQTIEMIPSMFSSESDEFIESETGLHIYTIRLFDEDLPELTSEEEVEILYRILTKKELYRR